MIKFKEALKSSNENVKKYIFEDETALVESVIYKYPDYETRTTICISVQSGCKVGCTFCGTGKKFLRDLTAKEITLQVLDTFAMEEIYDTSNIKKLQIMFMSMGEPSHNWFEIEKALQAFNLIFPNAELLISTVGTNNLDFLGGMLRQSILNDNIGLQFSIHHFSDSERTKIIPYRDKMSLEEISYYGKLWHKATGRHSFCNYVVTDSNNVGYEKLFKLFPPEAFNFTFSVLCNADESMKDAFVQNKDNVKTIHDDFLQHGYNVRMFDPAGQDDIGGGCGQLWYFQNKIKEITSK